MAPLGDQTSAASGQSRCPTWACFDQETAALTSASTRRAPIGARLGIVGARVKRNTLDRTQGGAMWGKARIGLTVAALVAGIVVLSGCGGSSRSSDMLPGYSEVAPIQAGSIPSLVFVDPDSLPAGTDPVPGTILAPGTYKVAMTGEHIESVHWVKNRAGEIEVWFQFDAEGTRQLAAMTKKYVSRQLPAALDGMVLAAPVVEVPLTDGLLAMSDQAPGELRALLDPAVVPIK